MATLAERILEALKAVPPPTGPGEIASSLGVQSSNVRTRISQLIRDKVLTPADLPWRAEIAGVTKGGYRKRTSRHLAKRAEEIANEGGTDRVAALRLLFDIQSVALGAQGPPEPEDTSGIIKALSIQMQAAGRVVCMEAMAAAFKEHDIIPVEAPNVPEAANTPEAEGDGLPPSGGSLA